MERQSVIEMWTQFLHKNKHLNKDIPYTSWYFGMDEREANELARLVMDGKKTATSSLFMLYGLENEPLPKVGEYNVITDYGGAPKAITKTIDVSIIPFKDVDRDFASKEGEGDRSLSYWRKVHTEFFTAEMTELNQIFHEDMLVVCEEFQVVHK